MGIIKKHLGKGLTLAGGTIACGLIAKLLFSWVQNNTGPYLEGTYENSHYSFYRQGPMGSRIEASKKAIDEAYDGLAKVPKARISKYYGRIIYNILKAIDNQRSVLDVLYNCKIR